MLAAKRAAMTFSHGLWFLLLSLGAGTAHTVACVHPNHSTIRKAGKGLPQDCPSLTLEVPQAPVLHWETAKGGFFMERISQVGSWRLPWCWLLLPTTQADRAEPGFDDVAGLPCETAAGALYQAGIVSGTAPHIFTPDSTLTRAQMATILVRAYAQEVAGEGKTFDGCTGKPLGLFLHWQPRLLLG